MVKNPPTTQDTPGQSLEKGMATHSSILAWRIPWTEEPRELQSMGSQRVAHNHATNTLTPCLINAKATRPTGHKNKEESISCKSELMDWGFYTQHKYHRYHKGTSNGQALTLSWGSGMLPWWNDKKFEIQRKSRESMCKGPVGVAALAQSRIWELMRPAHTVEKGPGGSSGQCGQRSEWPQVPQ